jgi:hypothetical protein
MKPLNFVRQRRAMPGQLSQLTRYRTNRIVKWMAAQVNGWSDSWKAVLFCLLIINGIRCVWILGQLFISLEILLMAHFL